MSVHQVRQMEAECGRRGRGRGCREGECVGAGREGAIVAALTLLTLTSPSILPGIAVSLPLILSLLAVGASVVQLAERAVHLVHGAQQPLRLRLQHGPGNEVGVLPDQVEVGVARSHVLPVRVKVRRHEAERGIVHAQGDRDAALVARGAVVTRVGERTGDVVDAGHEVCAHEDRHHQAHQGLLEADRVTAEGVESLQQQAHPLHGRGVVALDQTVQYIQIHHLLQRDDVYIRSGRAFW
eukprot:CAMPEP_0173179436 /NCGR_PEP_ID=MMETSP1141-20130122/6115_1 /TAXON_ID=483371 /ORGANISM="non described non described, Strain CCMP2298" /LENGTH=238 /DNA_ID=CAMNT_0014102087 /DNA_START=1444 /DNA_END=2157 /DNA_ORIENTATION=-